MKHEADIAYPIPEAGAGKIRIYKQKSPPYVLLGKSTGMESLPTGIPIFLEKREGPPAARRKVTPLRRSSRQCGPIVSKPRNQRVERLGERGVLAAFFMPRHRPPVVSVGVTESAQRCRTQRPGTPPADAEEPGGNYPEKEAGNAAETRPGAGFRCILGLFVLS